MPKSNQRRQPRKPSVPAMDAKLRDGLHRLSQREQMFWGHGLARLRQAHGQTVADQAASFGISEDALACWAVCKVPRPDNREQDLATVAGQVGVSVEVLNAVLLEAERLVATSAT